jgi:hypothetical protein
MIRRLTEVEERTTQKLNTLMAPGPGLQTGLKGQGHLTTATQTVIPQAEESSKHAHC